MTDKELKEKAREYIVWHDIDLNPDDLPTNKDPVWNEDGEMVYFDIDEKQWRRWRSNRQLSVHAWAKVIRYPPF